MKKPFKIYFVVIGLISGLLVMILADGVAGYILPRIGYFKNISTPSSILYTTSEFRVTANISSQGLRNNLVSLRKDKNTMRILALGDSFTFGWGVEENQAWPRLLEKVLNERLSQEGSKVRVEVINAGVPGAGPTEYLANCLNYKDMFDADIIIIGFWGTDDLYQIWADNNITPSLSKFIMRIFPTLGRINHRFIADWRVDSNQRGVIDVQKIWKEEAGSLIKQHPELLSRIDKRLIPDFLSGRFVPVLLTYAAGMPDYLINVLNKEFLKSSLEENRKQLKLIKDLCIKDKPAYLVVLPSQELVSREFFQYRIGTGFNIDEAILHFDLDFYLRPHSEGVGIRFLSLLPTFRGEQCIECFYPWDSHFTPLGHQKTADYIAKKLKI